MVTIHSLTRIVFVLMLAFGVTGSAVSLTSAQPVSDDMGRIGNTSAYHGTDDLVTQLVEILKGILSDILGGGDDLADVLPPQCEVTATGFFCDLSGGLDQAFLDVVDCEPTIFANFSCTAGGAEYACSSTNSSTATITCGGANLIGQLPSQCSVTAEGFQCDFTGDVEDGFEFVAGICDLEVVPYPCTIGDTVYTCSNVGGNAFVCEV